MLYPPVADLLENVESRYLLVNLVAHRARQIAAEAEMNQEDLPEKPVTMAIEEVADPIRAVPKTENTYCISPFSESSPGENALSVSSCGFHQGFLTVWPGSSLPSGLHKKRMWRAYDRKNCGICGGFCH